MKSSARCSRLAWLILLVFSAGLSGCGGGGAPPDLAAWVRPALSASRIVFTSNRKSRFDIFSMTPEGMVQQDLTVNPTGSFQSLEPASSWDGHHLAFSSNRKGNWKIFSMDASGLNVKRLTFNATSTLSNYEPAWSPNGAKIAFLHFQSGGVGNIWVANANGSEPQALTNDSFANQEPTWLPDGSGVVFSSNRKDGVFQLYKIVVATKQMTRLTFGGGQDGHPACAPDSTRIAFDSIRKTGGVFTVKLDGTDMRHVPNTVASIGAPMHPSWGPGGTALAFAQFAPGGSNLQIYKINLDGTGKTRLTKTTFPDQWPSWGRSPS